VPYNFLERSQEFDNATFWGVSQSSISANATVAPDGTNTADKLIESNTNSIHELYTNVPYTLIAGSYYTESIFAKSAERTQIAFNIVSGGFSKGSRVIANLSNGTLGTITNFGDITDSSATITNVGNGWYRISITLKVVTTDNFYVSPAPVLNDNVSYTGNGTSGVYIWGAQLVTGSSAKEYFPTTDRLNVPRLDYTNSSCPSILVEPQRTNLALYSEQFNNAAWSKGTITTVTANTVISPDGTQNADTVTCNGSGVLFTRQITYLATTAKCSNSIYAKKGNTRYFAFRNFGDSGGKHDVFDFDTKTWTQNTSAVLSYEELDNGWFRLKSVNSDVLGNYFISFFPTENTSGEEVDTVNNKNVYVWGAQAEVGSYATSYIPTVASSVTRNADVISKTGISSLIGQTEGVMYFDLKTIANSDFKRLSINGGSYVNSIFFDFDNTNTLYAKVFNGGSAVATLIASGINIANRNKIAIAYKNNDFSFYVNGTQVASQSSGSIPSGLANYEFSLASNQIFEGNINTAALWKTRLSNTELATLTTI
jgi:hypothetical protein